jgi:hypothetical protein
MATSRLELNAQVLRVRIEGFNGLQVVRVGAIAVAEIKIVLACGKLIVSDKVQ